MIDIEVTQADREAAAQIVGPISNEGKYPGFACDFREGRCDRHELTQAFAKHRQQALLADHDAAVKAERERCARVARQTPLPELATQTCEMFAADAMARKIAAAIRQPVRGEGEAP